MLIESFSGIRGVYEVDLTPSIARRYAFVFHEFLRKKIGRIPRIVVGNDTRDSTEMLKNAVFDALFNIIDVGIMPIAAVELAVRDYKADGGIMITASHNEPQFNGLKFLGSSGAILAPEEVKRVIQDFSKVGGLKEEDFSKNFLYQEELLGRVKKVEKKHEETISRYAKFFLGVVGRFKNKVKVVVDVNGGTGLVLNQIVTKLTLDNLIIVNDTPGEFKRRIEPDGESLMYLTDIIKRNGADFGAGLDCDADRIVVMLKDGSLVDGNYLLGLIVDYILKSKKGTVVTNDATSGLVRDIAKRHKCGVEEVEVGEINVVEKMLELKSPIGGEGSNGGIIIPPSRCRDGILSLLLVLKILSERKEGLQDLIKEYPTFYTLQRKIRIRESGFIKDKVRNEFRKYKLQETGGESGGLKVIMDDGFLWFRVSKTEPGVLRVIADSRSKQTSNKLLKQAEALFLNR
jgi:phosphomannomutase